MEIFSESCSKGLVTRSRIHAAALVLVLLCSMANAEMETTNTRLPEHGDKPDIVLVHGANTGGWYWFKVLTAFEDQGYNVTVVELAGNGKEKTPVDTVTTLEQFSKPLTDHVANASKKLILVGHSLGGVPVSLTMEMFPEKILKAIYIAAIMPLTNQSATDTFPPELLPKLLELELIVPKYGNGLDALPTSFTSSMSALAKYSLGESPKELVNLAFLLTDATPFAALTVPIILSPGRYGSVRRFYIKTGKDALLDPVSYQQGVIDRNPVEQTFLLKDSDHIPMFSYPEKLTKLLVHITTL